jgi:tetratricopeptide (TPR) repeat protein
LCLFEVSAFADFSSGLARASELLRAGHAEDAYRAYLALLREDPDNDEVNLGLTRAALAASHPYQAILAYERLIAKYPAELRLYREIANVYMSIGDSDMATRYLSRDASLAPDDISSWASRVGATYSRFQSHGKLRFGVLYDGNGNQGPDSDRLTLGFWNVTISGEATAQGGFGGWLAGDYDASYRTSRGGPWHLVGDAHFYARLLDSGELRSLDQDYSQWYRLAGGIRYSTPASLLDLRIKGEAFDYDFYNTIYSFGAELTYAKMISGSLHLVTRAGLERRDYVRDGDYDGTYGFVGQYARFLFGANANELTVGARYLWADARTARASYDGWEISAYARFKLKNRWEISPSLAYIEERYGGPATPLEWDDRRDRRWRAGLGAAYRISEAWSAEMNYSYTHNASNSALREYDRHLVSLGLAWSF